MPLHPLAQQFASVATEYDQGRPEYPPAVIGAVSAELRLTPAARVIDLGAGTGKVSRALLAAGLDVVAVEPLDSMRELLAASIGAERVVAGTAEAVPLPDGAVDAVTIGDAFHWFDQAAALREITRVLRPGGGLAILNSLPDWTGASWAHEVGQLLAEARPKHPHFDGPRWQDTLREVGGWSEGREITVIAPQATTPERVLAHIASMSWVAGMSEGKRAAWMEHAAKLIHEGTTPPELPVHVVIGVARLTGPAPEEQA
jgi:SAM-dependent methyltransferase